MLAISTFTLLSLACSCGSHWVEEAGGWGGDSFSSSMALTLPFYLLRNFYFFHSSYPFIWFFGKPYFFTLRLHSLDKWLTLGRRQLKHPFSSRRNYIWVWVKGLTLNPDVPPISMGVGPLLSYLGGEGVEYTLYLFVTRRT